MAALILPNRRVVQPQGPVQVDDRYAGKISRVALPGQSLFDLSTGVVAATTGTFTDPAIFVNSQGFGRQVHPSGGSLGANRWFWPPTDGITDNATLIFVGHPQNYSTPNGQLIARGRDGAGSGWNLLLSYNAGNSLLAECVTGSPVAGRTATIGSLTLNVGDEQRVALVKRNGSISVFDWRTQRSSTTIFAGSGLRSSTEGVSVGSSKTLAAAAHQIHTLDAAFKVALADDEVWALLENPWQLFRPIQRRIIVDLGAGGGTGATASATPATVTTTAPAATTTGAASASSTPAQATATAATATAAGSANAQATPADASAIPATGTATGAALASSAPASVQLTPATATASGEAGASAEATATPAPITIAASTATATGSASAQATPAQVTTTAPTATAASGISASATLAAIGLMPATGAATGGAITSAIPAQIIVSPAQATAAGSAWAFSAPAQISVTPATGSASEYIKPLYSEDPSAQFVGYPVDDHSVDYPLRLMAVNYPFDSNKVDFPLRVLRVNYPKQ